MAEIPFRGGTAKSLAELVDLCETHWEEARGYLYQPAPAHPFIRFLQDLGRETGDDTYRNLAREARAIVRENKDHQDVGLERFLQATNLVEEPIPDVDPAELVLDPSVPEIGVSMKLMNRGRGYLYGSLKADRELELEKKEFGVPSHGSVSIDVKLSSATSKAQTTHQSEITIVTNARRRTPEIKVKVAIGAPGKIESRPVDTRLPLLLRSMENHFEDQDWYAVQSDCEQILELEPEHQRATEVSEQVQELLEEIEDELQTGQEALAAGRWVEAEEHFRRVLELEPANRVAVQGLEQIKAQKQFASGCAVAVVGLAIGIGFGFWLRHRIEPNWLAVYGGYLAMSVAIALINGLFFQEKRFQGFICALLLPVGQLSVLFGTYVMWHKWILSLILAVSAGYFLSRQLQATFCWDVYQRQTGSLRNAWRSLQR